MRTIIFVLSFPILLLIGNPTMAQTQEEIGLTRFEEQLASAKHQLFRENADSARAIITSLMKELSTRNLLDSPIGLKARLIEASALELNNTRGEALEKIFSLIEACKVQKDWLTLSRAYLVAELAYEFLDKPDRCRFYFNQCRALIEEHDLIRTYPDYCIRLSTFSRIWGDKDSSYYYAEEALRTSRLLYEAQKGSFPKQRYEDFTSEYGTAHNIFGGFYRGQDKLEKAKHHFEQAKSIFQKVGNDYSIAWVFLQLSWLYKGQADYETALLYNDSSLVHGNIVYGEFGVEGKNLRSLTLLNRAGIYNELGQQDSIYQLLKQGYDDKVEVIRARNHLYATEVEARHTDEQKGVKIEQQDEQLSKERKWRLGLIGILAGFLLLAIGLVYFYLQLRKANRKTKIQAEELKQLDKVKSNFFANISHELRTPLTLILGPLSYILNSPDEWDKKDIQKQLLVMQRNGKSLMDLIEEILDLSKLEANKLELQEERTPVTRFFERLFFLFEPQFQRQELDYELILDVQKDLHLSLDRKKMEKVLNNFLSNAIKFTPKGGKITLQAKETDAELQILVTDTGKGIHPKDLPHIFERFYQSKQADQKLYGGTGIGLALVNEFAQLMGGKAHAESTLGAGSKFFFEIPKKEIAAKRMLSVASPEIQESELIGAIGTDFTILVVEDNDNMRDFIAQLLHPKYDRVLLARDGAEGLEALKEHGTGINLIVSDVMMPNVDGLTMLKAIKSHPEWYRIPVVMLTALAAERDKLTALTIGVDDYLTKPFSVSELLIRVQNLLFNYHQRMEWQASLAEEQVQEQQAENPEIQKHQEKTPQKVVSEQAPSIEDKEWVDKLSRLVQLSFDEGGLDVKGLAEAVFLSSRQLNRKLKAVTGLSPAKFIKEVQLQAARKTLENGTVISINEVAFKHGFEHQSTFSTLFKKRFGKSPLEYLKQAG